MEIATMKMAGETFDVEVIEDFRFGMSEVIAIGCYPFDNGASHATVHTDRLHNRRTEEIPDDLPIPADPSVDAPEPADVIDARAFDRQRAQTYAEGMGL